MRINLYCYTGLKKKVNKSNLFYNSWTTDGFLRDDTSFLHPVIRIKKEQPLMQNGYNYMYIPDFKRYYFIKDIRSIRTGVWEIIADVDVLYSNYKEIYETKAILEKSQGVSNANQYINDGSFVMDSHKFDQVVNFPSGLSDSGYNILICSGGA